MLAQETNATLIGWLRIRSRSSDPQAEQQRIARMLRSATLHPAGLPESAMLVVRRLADPLPSRLRAGPRDFLPDASWQRAVADALEKLAASASRPAYGAVPAETNAVLFCDRAEVLAALALDWMSGTLPVQWWWREILRGGDALTALLREWTRTPQYVPAALDLLAQRKQAVKFVQRVPQQVITEMLEAVLSAYSVPRLVDDDAAPRTISDSPDDRPLHAPRLLQAQARRQAIAFQAASSRWVPEAFTPGLSTSHTLLLLQALMLRRAPAVVRTIAFQKELRRWNAAAELSAEIEISEAENEQQEPPRKASRKEISAPEAAGEATLQQTSIDHAQPVSTNDDAEQISAELAIPEHRGIAEKERPAQRRSSAGAQAEGALAGDRSGMEAIQLRAEETEIISTPEASVPAARPLEAPAEQTTEPSISFETKYGGVFFLLTLALNLYIYGDFSSPAEMGLELNLWDFLALMGSELTEGKLEQDTLWDRLASLAGRPKSSRPGLDFDPPDEWRLPPEWLKPFPEPYDAEPVLINGRMVSKHPAGFLVIDIPTGTDVSAQETISREERLRRWVRWMSSYFGARLVRAVGREDAVELVCARPARVAFTLTHVDVTFSLDHHPIELRMAGLDRDLGWIPAGGRYVAFHFR